MNLIVIYVDGGTVLMPESCLYIPLFDCVQKENAPDGLRGAANQGAVESISKSVSVSSVSVYNNSDK